MTSMLLNAMGFSFQSVSGMIFGRIGWTGLAAIIAGAVLLLSMSSRAVKFFSGPRGMATTAAVAVTCLALVGWNLNPSSWWPFPSFAFSNPFGSGLASWLPKFQLPSPGAANTRPAARPAKPTAVTFAADLPLLPPAGASMSGYAMPTMPGYGMPMTSGTGSQPSFPHIPQPVVTQQSLHPTTSVTTHTVTTQRGVTVASAAAGQSASAVTVASRSSGTVPSAGGGGGFGSMTTANGNHPASQQPTQTTNTMATMPPMHQATQGHPAGMPSMPGAHPAGGGSGYESMMAAYENQRPGMGSMAQGQPGGVSGVHSGHGTGRGSKATARRKSRTQPQAVDPMNTMMGAMMPANPVTPAHAAGAHAGGGTDHGSMTKAQRNRQAIHQMNLEAEAQMNMMMGNMANPMMPGQAGGMNHTGGVHPGGAGHGMGAHPAGGHPGGANNHLTGRHR